MKQLILASSSPRRKRLLTQLGLSFTVDPSGHDETVDETLQPETIVKTLSQQKAAVVAKRYADAVILAADTIVVHNGSIIGKPKDANDAKQMLNLLQGNMHTVYTGFTIVDTATQKSLTQVVKSDVFMTDMSKSDINAYVKTGEPLDKAGGYGADEKGIIFIEKVTGDFYTIVGLPLSAVAKTLQQFGIFVL